MNRAFAIILIPAVLVAIGYVVVFRSMGITPAYWRLILPFAVLRRYLVAGTESGAQERYQRAVGQEIRRRDHNDAERDTKSRSKPSFS